MFSGNTRESFTVRDRVIYVVSQADGTVRSTERRVERTRFFIGFRLRGNF